MRVDFNDSMSQLWDSTKTKAVRRYRGLFPRKSAKQRKLDRMELLNIAIDGQWQTALELSRKTTIPFHQAVKLLQIAQWRYDIETKQVDWIDERKRRRTKTLYRRKKVIAGLYAMIFGQTVYDVPHSLANVRTHICKDD